MRKKLLVFLLNLMVICGAITFIFAISETNFFVNNILVNAATNHTCHPGNTYVVDVKPTCTSVGKAHYNCAVCGKKLYVTLAKNSSAHSYYPYKTVSPTCTSTGYQLWKCSRCSATQKRNVKAAYGHNFGAYKIKQPASCTQNGQKVCNCTRCGLAKYATISAKGHSYHPYKTVSPTCTSSGYELWKCSCCTATQKRNVKAAYGHNFGAYKIKQPASCTQSGQKVCNCTRCGLAKYETIQAKGHSYRLQTTVSPTCTSSGYELWKCSCCTATQKRNVKSAYGHTYGAYRTDYSATCTHSGRDVRNCTRCGQPYYKTTPIKSHSLQLNKTILPTCTEKGYEIWKCKNCSYTEKRNYKDTVNTYKSCLPEDSYFRTDGTCSTTFVGKYDRFDFKANYDWTVETSADWISVNAFEINNVSDSSPLFSVNDKEWPRIQSCKKNQLYAVIIRVKELNKWTEQNRIGYVTVKCQGFSKSIKVEQQKVESTWDDLDDVCKNIILNGDIYLDSNYKTPLKENDAPYFKGDKKTNGIQFRYLKPGDLNIYGKQITCYSFETIDFDDYAMVEYAFYSVGYDKKDNSSNLYTAKVEMVKSSGGFEIEKSDNPLITVSVGNDGYISTRNFSYTINSTDYKYTNINNAVTAISKALSVVIDCAIEVPITNIGLNVFLDIAVYSCKYFDNSDSANISVRNCSMTVELPKNTTISYNGSNNNEMVLINVETLNPRFSFDFNIRNTRNNHVAHISCN